jgi:hypothetical protein
MIHREIHSCLACDEYYCACGCEGKPGLCVKCGVPICPECYQTAHREHRGMCLMCVHPQPDDSDLVEYTARGFKINHCTEPERMSVRDRMKFYPTLKWGKG